MKKVKKYIYTLMLLITFIVASPFMVVKIWNSSELKTIAAKQEEEEEEDPMNMIKVVPIEMPATMSLEVTTEPPTIPPTQPETEPIKMDSNIDSVEIPPEEEPQETEPIETQPEPTIPPTEPPTQPPAETKPKPKKSDRFVTSDVSYFDDALFIGDSRTEDIKLYGTLTGADFFCSVGLSCYKVNTVSVDGMLLSDFLANKRYGKIYIMLGLNEIADNIEYTTGLYKELVQQIRQTQPFALIFIEANLHVTDWYSKGNPSQSNERLDTYNQIISELADNNMIFYIDVNEVFDDENGALPADATGDGVHPYAKYYSEWSEWLCTKTVIPGKRIKAK